MKPWRPFQKFGAAPAVELAVNVSFGYEYVPQLSAYSGQVALGRVMIDPELGSVNPGTGME